MTEASGSGVTVSRRARWMAAAGAAIAIGALASCGSGGEAADAPTAHTTTKTTAHGVDGQYTLPAVPDFARQAAAPMTEAEAIRQAYAPPPVPEWMDPGVRADLEQSRVEAEWARDINSLPYPMNMDGFGNPYQTGWSTSHRQW